MNELYDKNYFEFGVESGKSNYSRYRWIPELTIPMAMTMIDHLDIKPHHKILDFGAAKGFLVKAFRWLNRQAWGMDISEYAISNCDPEVREYYVNNLNGYDFIIAKDVFEHIPLDELSVIIDRIKAVSEFKAVSDKLFAIIPLGDNGKYRAPANDHDVTHVNCMTEDEWIQYFADNHLICREFTFKIRGIKDSYYEQYPTAHGFFTLCR